MGVSVLAEGRDDVCARLSSKNGDRFAGTSTTTCQAGALFVDGATAWAGLPVHAEVPSGVHDIALLHVHGIRADPAASPLIFHGSRFRRLAARINRSGLCGSVEGDS